MCEDMRALLNAYLDGELHGWRLLQVQNHLASCASCRQELKELRLVTDLLHAAPAPAFTPADRFVANLILNLPRRPLKAQLQRGPTLAWWLAPIGLLGLWFFVQIMLSLSTGVSLVAHSGLLDQATSWISTGSEHTLWYASALNLFGGEIGPGAQSTLSFLDQVVAVGSELFTQLLWQAGIALLYWIWMAAWWLRTRGRLALGSLVHP